MKETTDEIATLASKVMKSKSFSRTAKRLAASCLSQREAEVFEVVFIYPDGRKVCREVKRGEKVLLRGGEMAVEVN